MGIFYCSRQKSPRCSLGGGATHNHKPQTTNHKPQTTNHKPQLRPTTHNHHDEVRKHRIPYALGLTRSIAYRRKGLTICHTNEFVQSHFSDGIPFLTQPSHERTLTGRGSRVFPNVGATGCTLKVGAAGCTLTLGQPGVPKRRCSRVRPGRGRRCIRASPSQLGLRPLRLALRAACCMNLYYNLYKTCTNWYKNHTVYELVLHNLYNNCMNLYYTICIKISEKKDLHPGWDFNPGPIWLAIVAALRHPPPRRLH